MLRSAKALIATALCVVLVGSLGMTATAAPTPSSGLVSAGDGAVTAAKKRKKCRKGYVRTRVTVKKGKNKGKRVARCVKKEIKRVPQLSPV